MCDALASPKPPSLDASVPTQKPSVAPGVTGILGKIPHARALVSCSRTSCLLTGAELPCGSESKGHKTRGAGPRLLG